MDDMNQYSCLLDSVQRLHQIICRRVREHIARQTRSASQVIGSGNGDVSYGIDGVSEEIIDRWFANSPPDGGAVLICEGLGVRCYPSGISPDAARWRIIIDPLDGTRHIMYDNRSCWILTGIAPNHGENTKLSDIQAAIQTEVPVSLQEKYVIIKAIRDHGASLEVHDVHTDECADAPLSISPSTAATLEHGFAVFSNFFPGTKEIISAIEESTLRALYGEARENEALTFSEQYISNAGQLYMMITGKYRMAVDFRAELGPYQSRRAKALPLCTHPYDLSAGLIAREAGCILVNKEGNPLDYPLDLHTNCSWFCYANKKIFEKVHPLLIKEINDHNNM